MKNSVNKGFLSYLAIFLVIIAAVVLGIGAIMYLSPGVEILGYTFVNTSSNIRISQYDGKDMLNNTQSSINLINDEGEVIEKEETGVFIDFSSLTKLVIKTNGMPVNFIYSGEEDRIDISRTVSGFSKVEEVKKLEATKHYNSSTKTFTITALDTSPTLSLSNSSRINVYLKSRELTSLNLEVETASANLNVARSAFNSTSKTDLSFREIKYTTKTGNLTLSKTATITRAITVNSTESSNVVIGKDLTLASAFTVNLNNGQVTVPNLKATRAEISGEKVNLTGKILDFTLSRGLELKIKTGDVVLNKVVGNVQDVGSVAENLLVKIKEVTGNFTMNKVDVTKANRANVEIDLIGGTPYIKTSSGNIKIKKATSKVDLETISGSISFKMSMVSETVGGTSSFTAVTKTGTVIVNSEYIFGTNTITTESGTANFNYLHTPKKSFEINATSKSKNAITFKPENTTYEETNVVGYPSPLDNVAVYPAKVIINSGGRINVSAVNTLTIIK